MIKLVNISDLKSHLSDVIAKVSETGDTVVIGKYGKPVAKLIPFSEDAKSRSPGFGKHLVMTNIADLQNQVDEPVVFRTSVFRCHHHPLVAPAEAGA